jgi:hypothetical protein
VTAQVREYLEKHYEETSGDATAKLALKALTETVEASSKNIEVAVTTKDAGQRARSRRRRLCEAPAVALPLPRALSQSRWQMHSSGRCTSRLTQPPAAHHPAGVVNNQNVDSRRMDCSDNCSLKQLHEITAGLKFLSDEEVDVLLEGSKADIMLNM